MMMCQTEVDDLVESAVQEGAVLAVAVSPTGHLVVPGTK